VTVSYLFSVFEPTGIVCAKHYVSFCDGVFFFLPLVVCGGDSVPESRSGDECMDMAYTSCYLGLHSHVVYLCSHVQVSSVLYFPKLTIHKFKGI
jgi:hypothetical protein